MKGGGRKQGPGRQQADRFMSKAHAGQSGITGGYDRCRRSTFLEDKNRQNTAQSVGRYDAVRTVVPASLLMRMPPTGMPASMAPARQQQLLKMGKAI